MGIASVRFKRAASMSKLDRHPVKSCRSMGLRLRSKTRAWGRQSLFLLSYWVFAVAHSETVCAQLVGSAGRGRIELSIGGVFTANLERRSAQVLQLTLEQEWVLWPHITMAARAHPVMVYTAPRVLGCALGALNRIYLQSDASGGFMELGTSVLVHNRRFEGNSSYLNFLSTLAIGVLSRTRGWCVAVFLQHVSNAGIAKHNAGWNALGLRVGLVWQGRAAEGGASRQASD